MRLLFTSLALTLGLMAKLACAQMAATEGRVLLAASGQISQTNLGPLAAGTPSLIGYQDIGFQAAAMLDQAAWTRYHRHSRSRWTQPAHTM